MVDPPCSCSHGRICTFLHTGPGLALKGAVFPNYGVLRRDSSVIGEAEDALYCVTDRVACCGTPPSPDCCGTIDSLSGDGGSSNGQGLWFSQNDHLQSGTADTNLWYASWLNGAVLLNYRGGTGTTGLYWCLITDNTGLPHRYYTCVYDTGTSQCKSL